MGVRPAGADGPDMPPLLDYLWEWFKELSLGRAAGAFEPARITWLDIKTWAELIGEAIEPWEVRAILRIDTEWVSSARIELAEGRRKPNDKSGGDDNDDVGRRSSRAEKGRRRS